jgi:hypothetical protein
MALTALIEVPTYLFLEKIMDMSMIVPIVLIPIFVNVFKEWDEIEINVQAIKFKIKRRQAEYLRPNNLEAPSEKSSKKQLPTE